MLADDIDAIVFVRFPQFPSSRVFGDAPVISPWEFQTRLPADPSRQQIIPVPPRPFPDSLRSSDLLQPKRPASDYAAALWGLLLLVGIPIFVARRWKQWRNRSSTA